MKSLIIEIKESVIHSAWIYTRHINFDNFLDKSGLDWIRLFGLKREEHSQIINWINYKLENDL